MHIFSQATQEAMAAKYTIPRRAQYGQSPEVNSILHLRRIIGNQAMQRLLQVNTESLEAESRIAATTRIAHDFTRIPVYATAPVEARTKLTVNTPGDKYEEEADRIADQVMRMPEPCQKEQIAQGHEHLKTMHVGSNDQGQISVPQIVHSPGQPLDTTNRAFFEPRLGWDLSRVRIHADAQAAQSARSINARAYTIGNDIAFGSDEYRPTTMQGRRLLAHELAHVAQQNSVIHRQIIQRALLPKDRDCGRMTALPIHETATVPGGVYHTETFSRPSSGRIRVTVQATNGAEPDCTFGVNVWQCHILNDEQIEEQHIENVGNTISYEIALPVEEWNTYDKFALRIRVNCQADLDVKVDPA